jgi:hypothetical protein
MVKELEDYSWFPGIIRCYQAEFIGSVTTWLDIYQPIIPEVEDLVAQNHSDLIQDLCSGSGIPANYIRKYGRSLPRFILSDKYPRPFLKRENYLPAPVDVLNFHADTNTCYTMFNAFHHFGDDQQKEIIEKIMKARTAFLFVEILQPGLLSMLRVIITAAILQLLTAPFVKPFSLGRLFFTYIIPVNIFTVLYDGIISVFRSRSSSRYRSMFEKLSSENYKVSVDKYSSWKTTLICIKGSIQ